MQSRGECEGTALRKTSKSNYRPKSNEQLRAALGNATVHQLLFVRGAQVGFFICFSFVFQFSIFIFQFSFCFEGRRKGVKQMNRKSGISLLRTAVEGLNLKLKDINRIKLLDTSLH